MKPNEVKPGTNAKVCRIRLIATGELIDELAKKAAAMLEASGFEVLEWSIPYDCRPPDDDKQRIYLMARLKGD